MKATIELHLEEGVKFITRSFSSLEDAKNWLIKFQSDSLIIGYTEDGTFGVVYG